MWKMGRRWGGEQGRGGSAEAVVVAQAKDGDSLKWEEREKWMQPSGN